MHVSFYSLLLVGITSFRYYYNSLCTLDCRFIPPVIFLSHNYVNDQFCLLEFQLQSYTLSDINNLTFFLRKLLKIVEKNENPLLFIFHCCVIDDDFNFFSLWHIVIK